MEDVTVHEEVCFVVLLVSPIVVYFLEGASGSCLVSSAGKKSNSSKTHASYDYSSCYISKLTRRTSQQTRIYFPPFSTTVHDLFS